MESLRLFQQHRSLLLLAGPRLVHLLLVHSSCVCMRGLEPLDLAGLRHAVRYPEFVTRSSLCNSPISQHVRFDTQQITGNKWSKYVASNRE
jgi:hypothetical protein